ncbi:MAG: ribonuclease HI family protein [Chloroflexi bacterium]|nr:ribonuclease HI family protein [Chloroflexota bacterium]
MADDSQLTIYVDGASRGNPGPGAIGIAIDNESGKTKVRISSYIGKTTNNQAEYRALIAALNEAAKLKARHVDINSDSMLLVEQVRGRYRVRHPELAPLFQQVKQLLAGFNSFTITHIPRHLNTTADALANEALDRHLGNRD